MSTVVYDIETIKNFFLYVDVDYETREEKIFKIGLSHNDLPALVKHLKAKPNQVGFNNLAFDAQVTQYILNNAPFWIKSEYTGAEINDDIYKYAQVTITKMNGGGWADYPAWKLTCPQLDLFKIWHFDNKAKMTSLKWVQFSMDWHDLQDMPMEHFNEITEDQVEDVIKYCRNDVMSTLAFFDITLGRTSMDFYKGKDKLQLRKDIMKKTGIDVRNMNDVKMGDEMNKDSYVKLTGVDKRTLKELRAPNQPFNFGECIPSYCSYKTVEMQDFYNSVKNIEVNPAIDQKFTVKFRGTEYTIAKGGIHSKDKPRVLKPNQLQLLVDADIGSQYPNGIIKRRLFPRHLGPEWLVVYESNIKERLTAKKEFKLTKDKRFKNIDEVFKLALNGGGFGKTGEPTSWQYDPFVSMSVTIGNQFEILMLIEMLELEGIHILSANTDGILCLIGKSQHEKYLEVCLAWELIVGNNISGKLEYTYYDLFAQRGVNSYIAVKTDEPEHPAPIDERIKTKNDFLLDIEIHKNKSNLIVNKALKEYFINNIDPKIFIKSHTNIFDFCSCVRGKGSWYLEQEGIRNGEVFTHKLQKTVRYFNSTAGSKILKRNPDGRQIEVEAGRYMQTVFNKYEEKPMTEYNIDYEYYIEKTYDIINEIIPEVSSKSTQLSMLFAA